MDDATALSTHRSRKQVVKMLVGIVLLFFVSLTPLRVVILWQISSSQSVVSKHIVFFYFSRHRSLRTPHLSGLPSVPQRTTFSSKN